MILTERIRTTKRERAILVALAYPEPTPGKRTDLLKLSTGADAIDKGDLSRARAIVKWCPDERRPSGSRWGNLQKRPKICKTYPSQYRAPMRSAGRSAVGTGSPPPNAAAPINARLCEFPSLFAVFLEGRV
jgi:hypothetical protein